jgi:hypothetical protein
LPTIHRSKYFPFILLWPTPFCTTRFISQSDVVHLLMPLSICTLATLKRSHSHSFPTQQRITEIKKKNASYYIPNTFFNITKEKYLNQLRKFFSLFILYFLIFSTFSPRSVLIIEKEHHKRVIFPRKCIHTPRG